MDTFYAVTLISQLRFRTEIFCFDAVYTAKVIKAGLVFDEYTTDLHLGSDETYSEIVFIYLLFIYTLFHVDIYNKKHKT